MSDQNEMVPIKAHEEAIGGGGGDIVDPLVETPLRYAGFLGRVPALLSKHSRLLAYSSDVGEAFRNVTSPKWVKASYGISWAYVFTDVGLTTKAAHDANKSTTIVGRTAVHTLTFQVLASILTPMVIIHSAVKYGKRGLARHFPSYPKVQRWGASAIGLTCIPFMPLVDEPIEHAVEYAFDNYIWPLEHVHSTRDLQLPFKTLFARFLENYYPTTTTTSETDHLVGADNDRKDL